MIEHIKGCFEAQGFTGSEIQARHSKIHFLVGDLLEVTLLRKVLSEQTIGVFIGTTFPGSIGMSEVVFELEQLSDLFMIGKLLAMIGGQGMNLVPDRKQESMNLILNRLGTSLRDFTQQSEARFSFSQCHQGLFVVFAKHRIHFPVAQAFPMVDNGRTLFNTAAIEQFAPPIVGSVAFPSLLLATQMLV